jgi:hypothetical protein
MSRIVTASLESILRRRGKAKTAVTPPAAMPWPPPITGPRPARIALLLALAHKIRNALDTGKIHDRGDAARRLGLTTTRVRQLLDLTLLAPDIQERLLLADDDRARGPRIAPRAVFVEPKLRRVVRHSDWGRQRELLGRAQVQQDQERPARSLCDDAAP